MSKQKISWVIPIYNEAPNIAALYEAMSALRREVEKQYITELIFVNDGSSDSSEKLLAELFEKDTSVKVINFSRNFGQQMAITAGLDYATGDAIIFIDADLQDPPIVSLDLIERWEDGNDVVYAKRRTRKDGFLKKLTAYWFYKILKRVSDIAIPEDTGDFRLISKRVAETLKQFPERHRFLRGLVSYVGFRQCAVLFDRDERKAGKSGYSIKKMLKLAEDAFTGFSLAPIMLVGLSGTLLAIAGFIGVIVGLIASSNLVIAVSYATILAAIILISLSTIGQYIGRTYQQVQGRPLYIVKDKLEHEK